MSSTALAERELTAPTVTSEQLDLIKKTVASGATDAELKLYLFDCARRGIHPLDKLLHFTKRGGKYTPVTSIDFMRSQAAMSGEMAGSDDAVFFLGVNDLPLSACVTVYRITAGQRFAYTATARWSEYCPDNAQMWKRMPHTMLAKCAEALALRKAFPQQLAGLYAKEELDQAEQSEPTYIVEAPRPPAPAIPPRVEVPETRVGRAGESIGQSRVVVEQREVAQSVERRSEKPEGAGSTPALPASAEVDLQADLPPGVVMITSVRGPMGKAKGFVFHSHMDPHKGVGEGLAMYDDRLAAVAESCCDKLTPVRLKTKVSEASGKTYLIAIEPVDLSTCEAF